MEIFSDDNTCIICLKKHDNVFSINDMRNGLSASEKLIKIGVKAPLDDAKQFCICCECSVELDITVSFLDKCEKSLQILNTKLAESNKFPKSLIDQKHTIQRENCIEQAKKENDNCYVENRLLEIFEESFVGNIYNVEIPSNDKDSSQELKCVECGSKRRCKHWSPPRSHTCPYCQKIFTRKFNFNLHLCRSASGTGANGRGGARGAGRARRRAGRQRATAARAPPPRPAPAPCAAVTRHTPPPPTSGLISGRTLVRDRTSVVCAPRGSPAKIH